MDASITPYKIQVPEEQLDDLKNRLQRTRWPPGETAQGWSQGVPLAEIQDLCEYWRESYDWRRCEAFLNSWPQFQTVVDSVRIHFLHIRSKHDDAVPVLLTHGWPGSILEFRHVIAPLTDPTAHSGSPEDAFHLVIPALPGFGLSEKPLDVGWNPVRIAKAWAVLMERLGYKRWYAQGGKSQLRIHS